MAGAMSSARLLAAAVAAAAAATPGGSNNHGRASHDRKAAMSAALFPTGRFTRCSLVAPTGAPARHGKSRQLAVVVAAATSAPGGSDGDDQPCVDCEAAVSIFRLEMESFKLTQRSVALVRSPEDPLLEAASGTAEQSKQMLEFLLTKKPIRRENLEGLIRAGKSFLIVGTQAKQGYVKADSLVNAIEGVKLVGTTFFENANLPNYTTPVVPLAADDVDKDSFFKKLVNLLVVFYTAVYWKARAKYGFGEAGAN